MKKYSGELKIMLGDTQWDKEVVELPSGSEWMAVTELAKIIDRTQKQYGEAFKVSGRIIK